MATAVSKLVNKKKQSDMAYGNTQPVTFQQLQSAGSLPKVQKLPAKQTNATVPQQNNVYNNLNKTLDSQF